MLFSVLIVWEVSEIFVLKRQRKKQKSKLMFEKMKKIKCNIL